MLKGSEDTASADNSVKVASLQIASSSGVTSAPLASKQPLPFVQVTMNDYADDDDLPATVSHAVFCIYSSVIGDCALGSLFKNARWHLFPFSVEPPSNSLLFGYFILQCFLSNKTMSLVTL
jgi:hypothetical protein